MSVLLCITVFSISNVYMFTMNDNSTKCLKLLGEELSHHSWKFQLHELSSHFLLQGSFEDLYLEDELTFIVLHSIKSVITEKTHIFMTISLMLLVAHLPRNCLEQVAKQHCITLSHFCQVDVLITLFQLQDFYEYSPL